MTEIGADSGTTAFAGSQVGDAFSARFVYDSESGRADYHVAYSRGSLGYWRFDGGAYGASVVTPAATLSFKSDAGIGVYNDFSELTDSELAALDSQGVTITPGDPVDGWLALYKSPSGSTTNTTFGIEMLTRDTSFYGDTGYQPLPPALTDVDAAFFHIGVTAGSDTSFGASGSIDSLSVSSVPLPGTVWLFGSGLLSLIGAARCMNA
ncbi:MAG: hypothetical protein WCC36_15710 [Gammaproteobacteria bacterium]